MMISGVPRSYVLRVILAEFVITLSSQSAVRSEEEVVSQAHRHADGCLVHVVESQYQAGPTEIRVLLPDEVEAGKDSPVIYVLPVEAGKKTRWGDSLAEVKTHDLHNMHAAIFVFPTFENLPWYADHPTDTSLWQESYFTEVVVPFVSANYSASDERLLLGFSKSGWGAWALLLRHPDKFSRAAAWDAPLMMDRIGKYGTSGIMGTQQNFEKYRLSRLVRENADALGKTERLVLTGYGNFRSDHQQAHKLLQELEIPHIFRDGPARDHSWHSGWLPEAVSLLLGGDQ